MYSICVGCAPKGAKLFCARDEALTVYIELVLIDNYLMDFLILYFAVRFSDKRVRLTRVAIGAAIGATYSALAVAVPFMAALPIKAVAAVVMCLPLRSPKPIKAFLNVIAYMILISFVMGGAVLAVAQMWGDAGVGYINVPAFRYILLGAAIGVTVTEWLLRTARPVSGLIYTLEAELSGTKLLFRAMLDTGNSITDLSGGGVIVADKSYVIENVGISALENINEKRPFFIETAAGAAQLEGYFPTSLTLKVGEEYFLAKAYIVLADNIARGEINALLGPKIRLTKTRRS